MRKYVLLLGALAVTCAVTACSSNRSASAAATTPPASVESLAQELARCVRANGVPNLPDLIVENGHVVGPSPDPASLPALEAALAGPCRSLKDRVTAAENGGEQTDAPLSADDLAKARQFAQCLRTHGLPQWPDPDPSGTFHIAGTGLEPLFAKKSGDMPQPVTDAVNACKQVEPADWGIGN